MTTVWGPVLLQLAHSYEDRNLDDIDAAGVELYWDIVFAAAHKHSTPSFHERGDEILEDRTQCLDATLAAGWHAGEEIGSPQTVYTSSQTLSPVRVTNARGIGDSGKPDGVLWTSSRLPDGASAWEQSELSEFPELRRNYALFAFDLASDEEVFQISSVRDFERLVVEYPRVIEPGRVGVDWGGLSGRYVAVNLTSAGLARVQNFRIVTDRGVAELSDWDAECTAWLRLLKYCGLVAL
ncbi:MULTISPECIES: hypothetical protein [unclassified Pseudonocardia]|uniref:hypothetical protein n=1 Tax=unclassified Pseudonocardia TaxID=2619320 RepID=UPI0011150D7F|nr:MULTISPECIES: hypothetical protein [unclassified Pseudonocardia]